MADEAPDPTLHAVSVASVRELVHLRREIGPRDSLAAMSFPAAPVQPSAPDVHLAELLTAGVDVELETTAGFRELRDVQVRIYGVLPFDVRSLRSFAHGIA